MQKLSIFGSWCTRPFLTSMWILSCQLGVVPKLLHWEMIVSYLARYRILAL